jgi:hypothetical protein
MKSTFGATVTPTKSSEHQVFAFKDSQLGFIPISTEDCETLWEVSNAVFNRRMWDCKIPGACKTMRYSDVEILNGHHA